VTSQGVECISNGIIILSITHGILNGMILNYEVSLRLIVSHRKDDTTDTAYKIYLRGCV
jgi:hypothetical protein